MFAGLRGLERLRVETGASKQRSRNFRQLGILLGCAAATLTSTSGVRKGFGLGVLRPETLQC